MRYYLLRLFAPRPTFMQDMTAEERVVMQAHSAHWRGWMARGNVVVFGAVDDPGHPFGVGVIRFEEGVDPSILWKNDPAMTAGLGFRVQIHPMLTAVVAPP